MTFLALIIALVLTNTWPAFRNLQVDDWFQRFSAWLGGLGLPAPLALLLAVVLPVIVTSALLASLEHLLFGVFWIVTAVFLLLYAFGRRPVAALFAAYYAHLRDADFEAAYLDTVAGAEPLAAHAAGSAAEVHELVAQRLAYTAYQGGFAVVFWFLLLGPGGALAYRLLQLHQAARGDEFGARCLHLADWVPVRLLAAGCLLTGDFMAGRESFGRYLTDGRAAAGPLLATVGQAASGAASLPAEADDAQLAEACLARSRDLQSLLHRAAVAWLVLLSLYIIFA
jgi:AmpE protein